MSIIIRTSTQYINLDNVTHAHITGNGSLIYAAAVLNGAGDVSMRLTSELPRDELIAKLKAAGFIGDRTLMVNPKRIVQVSRNGAIAHIRVDGYHRTIIAPAAILDQLDQQSVSSAGKSRRKKA